MSRPYQLLEGDVRQRLAELPDNSVHCIVTSPPYFGLRDYNVAGQIGLESNWREHIAVLHSVFEECRRVLRHDGTMWVNYGDAYAQNGHPATREELDAAHDRAVRKSYGTDAYSGYDGWNRASGTAGDGLKPKDLMGLPWRLAFALQDSGWWLRADCIWSKANPMPMPPRGRPTVSHEYVFLFAKSKRYFYDTEAVRVPLVTEEKRTSRKLYNGKSAKTSTFMPPNPAGRNLWTVWNFPCQSCPDSHFATFPEALPEICIRASTPEQGCCEECGTPWERVLEPTEHGKERLGKSFHHHQNDLTHGHRCKPKPEEALYRTSGWKPGCKCACLGLVPATVLDPFAGSSTTGIVALREGRRFIGIELNPQYCNLSRQRLEAQFLGSSQDLSELTAPATGDPVRVLRGGQIGLFA